MEDIFPVGVVTQAIILAGGRGTRLGALTSATPKPLLPVGGRPFISYLLRHLKMIGVRDVVISTGYLGECFEKAPIEEDGLTISLAREPEALGTGGGTRFAMPFLPRPEEKFLLCNGDSLFDIDPRPLGALVESGYVGALALRHVADMGRYGEVVTRGESIAAFREKASRAPGWINGGVYCLSPRIMEDLPRGASSLERDVFPALAVKGALAGHRAEGIFIDMGLPETYEEAQTILPEWGRQCS